MDPSQVTPFPWSQILAIIGGAFAVAIFLSILGNWVVYLVLKGKAETNGVILKNIETMIGEMKSQIDKLFARTDSTMCETHKEKLATCEKRLDAQRTDIDDLMRRMTHIENIRE